MPLAKKRRLNPSSQAKQSVESDDDDFTQEVEEKPKEWKIVYPRHSKTPFTKIELPYKLMQISPFVAKFDNHNLDIDHVVLPKNDWWEMKRYAKFISESWLFVL